MRATDSKKHKVLMIHMSRQEAFETIKSLTHQLATGQQNGGRYEKFLEDGRDFSIAVDPPIAIPTEEQVAELLKPLGPTIKEGKWEYMASRVRDMIRHYRAN